MKNKKIILIGLFGIVALLATSSILSLKGDNSVVSGDAFLSASDRGDVYVYEGYIRDENSIPLTNAHIELISNGQVLLNHDTGTSGYYRMSTTEVLVNAQLEVSKEGYKTQTRSVSNFGDYENFKLEPQYLYFSDDFNTETTGSNPSNWIVQEDGEYAEVSVISTVTEGIITDSHTKMVKMHENIHFALSEISLTTVYNFNPIDPILLSFQTAFYTNDYENINYGYVHILSSSMYDLLWLRIDRNGIYFAKEGGDLNYEHVYSDFDLNHVYDIDLVFQLDENSHISYTFYVNKEIEKYDTIEVTGKDIGYLKFGAEGFTNANFFVDNVFFGEVAKGNTYINSQLSTAAPLCRLFAPHVQGVRSHYRIEYSKTVTAALSLSIGQIWTISVDLINVVIADYTKYYGFSIGYGEEDAIAFIRSDFELDITEIILPGESRVYLELYKNVEHLRSEFDDQSVSDYTTLYGEESLPYLADDSIASENYHQKTYSQDYGEQIEYEESASATNKVTIKIGYSKYCIGLALKFVLSESMKASTWLTVDRALEPTFAYGKPTVYGAYLQIQPWIVAPWNPPEEDPPVEDPPVKPPPKPEPGPVPVPKPVPKPTPD
ncbi:MAG: hypothetical protein ACFE9I_13360 [Candidatus Hermodarchaeota archaeon]